MSERLFALLQHPIEPQRWQAVLLAMAEVERIQAAGTGFEAGPIPPLSLEWVRAADDGSPEFRLALALAGATGNGKGADPIRHHFLPLDESRRYQIRESRLVVRVVARGRDALADLLAVVERRLIEAERGSGRTLPIMAAPGTGARLDDLAAFLTGSVDMERTILLARALMALDWKRWSSDFKLQAQPQGKNLPDEAWMALRLALLPWPLEDGRKVPADPAIVRRLAAGDAASAIDTALRRLHAAGIPTTLRSACADAATARRWGAALAFPIHRCTAKLLAKHLSPFSSQE